MTAFCNNLREGDVVEYHGRRATVETTPRESSRMTSIQLPGCAAARYVPVMDLRLVVDGVAEDVPPIDGEAGPLATPRPRPEPPRRGFVEIAIMCRGQQRHVSALLRSIADGLDQGCGSGGTGDANPASGRWIVTP